MSSKLLRACIEPVGCFILPGLFAGWLFWASRLLPLPWPGWASALVAGFVWYLLAYDAGSCLGLFGERQKPQQTAVSEDPSLEVKLEGVLKLFAVHLLVTLAMYGAGFVAASYLR